MNIKEMEGLSGMTRANIRFYEEKGLLRPARGENGYRNYGQEDLRTLQRIRLLRSLEMPIEEIRALQTGEKQLSDALRKREEAWAQCQARAADAREICRALRAEGATYATLDAPKYLAYKKEERQPEPALRADKIPYPFCPWRRFFARWLDRLLTGLLWSALLGVLFHVNMTGRTGLQAALDAAVVLGLTLILEPIFLHCFGATPGKWIMGLRLEGEGGRKLSLADARARTWGMLWRGEGLTLPIYGLIRLWKSYRSCEGGEEASWDFENSTVYILRDTKTYRGWILAGCAAAALGLEILCAGIAALPPCRGRMTVADFARNYNFIQDFYGGQSAMRLDENARWVEAETDGVIIRLDGGTATPEWQFTLDEAGNIREIAFHIYRENETQSVGGAKNAATTAALAFIGAQPTVHALSSAPQHIVSAMNGSGMASGFDAMLFGVHARYACRQEGYFAPRDRDMMLAEDEEDNFLSIDFSMTLE